MSYNSDELVAPEWVNSSFFKEILEYNGDLKNVKVTTAPDTFCRWTILT